MRHTRCALVTGFQTCALPISTSTPPSIWPRPSRGTRTADTSGTIRSSARASCWRAWRMTDPATPQRDPERRRLNVMEALIIAALLGIGGLIFRLNDSVTRLPEIGRASGRERVCQEVLISVVAV